MLNTVQTEGKWHGILITLGVDERFLSPRHGPCPICGGKDRYRFDNRDGKGTWICSVCGAGDGFKLLMKMFGWNFKACADKVGGVMAGIPYIKPKESVPEHISKEILREMWIKSQTIWPLDIAGRYLSQRGINISDFPDAELRTIEKCRNSRGEYYPAMLAVVKDSKGVAVTFHRTYLSDGGKAEIESPREMMAGKLPDGAAIRLAKAGNILGVAEGVETALSASMIFNVPTWAAVNAVMMQKWMPPDGVKEVYIFGDNDKSFTGQMASFVLANKLAIKGFEVKVMIPLQTGFDWNDVLMEDKHVLTRYKA